VVCGDEEDQIRKAITHAFEQAEIVIMTGGLGPTKDDITKTVLASYFHMPLEFHPEVFERVKEYFHDRSKVMPELNRNQAMLPRGCKILRNRRGTASGMWFEHNSKVLISLPGVPYEMQTLMAEEVIPLLSQTFEPGDILHRTVLTYGIGESRLAEMLEGWENSLMDEHIKLAYLPSPGMVKLRLSVYGGAVENPMEAVKRKEIELLDLIGDAHFGFDNDDMASVVGSLCKQHQITLSAAESCSAGALSYKIVSVPGSSSYFMGSVVTYSSESKMNLLGVNALSIRNHGVVSERVALEMAEGVRKLLGTDYALSATGVAGPDGGDEINAVGAVWIGISSSKRTAAFRFQFGKSRQNNMEMTATAALNLLRKEILADLSQI
jgi:nicotinamide-nucleotide amidase